ncbi:uncharacterized protein LTR77_007894 [Saxophila tyrrhenica]|uniref:PWI domain-containing protein n=1 Tax=Saxophila tyrrhenica TaxID=1690608 RepID=A0AAV9P3F1_9PEZI|nr:hypothetical protein LTR77_007894 [Saxophila tyrrhenica]
MAYNYGAPPGAYNSTRQPSYSGAPSMGPPPGMEGAPGMPSHSPAVGQQPQFQPPPNMPNINFNAPVIRLGMQDQGRNNSPADRISRGGDNFRGSNAEPLGRRDRAGLGGDRDGGRNLDRMRAEMRESIQAQQPPTREEVARTIFIGGLNENAPSDSAIEKLLFCAGKLRRWTRVRDADDKVCKFGFAEYEDVDSLDAANEIFVNLEVPMFKPSVASVIKDEETGEVQKMSLLVVVDEQSKKYIDEWKGRSKREDEDSRQFRIDGCKEDLRQCVASLQNMGAFLANGEPVNAGMADAANGNGVKDDDQKVVNIAVALEDELSDIPPEMRATVASEIRAFRDRSTQRDLERLKREEELEQAERQRSERERGGGRASPTRTFAPSGPASASNGIPVGPRGAAAVPNAPSGPRGYRGAQMPSDYVNGVNFVGANGVNGVSIRQEDEDDSASDEELERRRKEKKSKNNEADFLNAEARWVRKENTRANAQDRERMREDDLGRARTRAKDVASKQMQEFNDDEEIRKAERAEPGAHEYFIDPSKWAVRRHHIRKEEAAQDAHDRQIEARERAEANSRSAHARGMADNFMDEMNAEFAARAEQQPAAQGFKISLGSAAARSKAATTAAQTGPSKRGMADMENLLEDEEDAGASGVRKPLGALKPLPTATAADMTEEEKAAARAEITKEIPISTDELFSFPMKYEYLTPAVIEQQVKPFVEKKVVEYLGVQEDLLVDAVVDGLKERKSAKDVVEVLEEALEEEAEVLVRKVWRLAAFWGECGARGLA